MSVLTAAWTAAGSGRCARCATRARVVPTRVAVSSVFIGFDGWGRPVRAWPVRAVRLGLPDRAAAHSPAPDRRSPQPPPAAQAAPRRGLRAARRRPARRPHRAGGAAAAWPQAPVLPRGLGPGHLDDLRLPWSVRDAHLLRLVADLRGRGFGTRMLTRAAPPFPPLRRLPTADWAYVMRAWAWLDRWRTHSSSWLDLALHITTIEE